MDTSIDILNESERKTRKRWLILTIISCFLRSALLILIGTVYLFITNDPFKEILSYFFSCFFLMTLDTLQFWWVYHCAYKKRGTALLLFFLITSPLLLIYFLWLIVIGQALGPKIGFTILLSFSTWWYILSYKLRNINKKLASLSLDQTTSPPKNLSN